MTISNSIVLADGAFGTLASSLAVTDTTLAFTTGHGARFPAVVSGQVMYLCILNSGNVLEEIKVTAHTDGSDSATITRAANGTSAKAWNAGDRIEGRLSSEILERLQAEALKMTALVTSDSGATYTASMANTALGYVTGLVYALSLATSNNGTTPTIAIDGLAAITVKGPAGAAVGIGDMPVDGLYLFDGSNFLLMNPVTGFPAGTVMLFMQTAAPTGWTKSSSHNDKALRIVSGAVSSGGSSSFTTIFGAGKATGSTAADLASHAHTISQVGPGSFTAYDGGGATAGVSYSSSGDTGSSHSISVTVTSPGTDFAGAGGGHTHTVALDLQYADVISAVKN